MPQKRSQTGLGFEELTAELHNPKLGLPSCLVLNELGIMCWNHDRRAEEVLRQILEKESSDYSQLISLSFLTELIAAGTAQPKTVESVERFRQNPANKQIVEDVNQNLEIRKSRLN